MKVLITAPLRQDLDIFLAHQESLDNLIIPEGVEVDRFYIVNDCPEVIPHIKGRYAIANSGEEYTKTGNDHIWTPYNLAKMPILRNRTIHEAWDYDYWFSVDTDLVLHPMTLKTLLEADKDIVSEVFWTQSPNGEWWCNAWMYDQCDMDGKEKKWREPGLYQVGMTGACTLVKREVFGEAFDKVNYSPIPNIRRCLCGEDRWFSIRAAVYGYEMWLDTHYPATHLYTRKDYEDWLKQEGRR